MFGRDQAGGKYLARMQVAVLRDTISAFAKALHDGYESGLEPLYETIPHWAAAWPPATPERLPEVLDAALTNTRSRVYWNTRAYFPKEALLEMARFAPDMLNMAFGRLFAADVDLGDRLSGFVFYLDEIFGELRRHAPSHARKTHVTHYHGDYRAPSLYCALRFPETHAYLEPDVYLQALAVLKAPNVGPVAEASRFAKSVRVVRNFLGKEPMVAAAHAQRLRPGDYDGPAALLVSEYFRFLASAHAGR